MQETVQNEYVISLVQIFKNFKVTGKHETKLRALMSLGALCDSTGHTPTKLALLRSL